MRMKTVMEVSLLVVAVLTAIALLVTSVVPTDRPHKFEARDGEFFIDGKPILLVSGEMHFCRVLPEDWDTRLKQAKAMGLNTVSLYLFWNLCEPREGEFDFTGMTDVRRMLRLCRENGLWAILRPGPYCCAEFEYGGIPWWTAKYPEVPIRSTDPQWLRWSRRYIEQVYAQVGDLQVTHGGPLLMVQMDNEHGMISGGNESYMVAMHKIFTGAGFDTQLFTCDPGRARPAGELRNVLRGHNGYRGAQPDSPGGSPRLSQYPIFVPELYTNWFTGWGMPLATRHSTIKEVVDWTSTLIDEKASFNYYMFHGGTTFGFLNGCNEYLPVHTSYDYSAPIDEAGRTTGKYRALRRLISEKLAITPPEPPADPPVIRIPTVRLDERRPLIERLPDKPARVADQPATMEVLDQAYGFVLYRKSFQTGLKGVLTLKQPMDYAVVMVDGRTVGRAFRGYGEESYSMELPETDGPATLDILVYNLGRISVITAPWTQDRARKGLIGGASLDGKALKGWEMYSLPLESVTDIEPSDARHIGPTFYRGKFSLTDVGGTFLDMRRWSMGVVWVNGHNLGRFWDRGALRSLFVPRHWLKEGENEIVVLELHDAPDAAEISGGTQIVTSEPQSFDVRLDQPASFFPSGNKHRDYPGFTIRTFGGD
ncbi:MAG: beta-galactosidase [Sedimentisphaerales bacterium]|nr:beta-galactosidase [Sedimentisphaerales bacterium]